MEEREKATVLICYFTVNVLNWTQHCDGYHACVKQRAPYPLSLLPDPDALQQVVDDLGGVLAAFRGTTDVGDLIWASPIICKKQK